MKHLLSLAVFGTIFFSCQKEVANSSSKALQSQYISIHSIISSLQGRLSQNDLNDLDTNRWYKSFDRAKKVFYTRMSFQNKDLAYDFIILKSDSLNRILDGKIIHVDAEPAQTLNGFNGTIKISSLDRKQVKTKYISDGRWKDEPSSASMSSMMQEEPAGEQDLPPVIVTSYNYQGSSTGNWYLFDALFEPSGMGDDGNDFFYGYAGGGGTVSNNDNTMIIEEELNDLSPINVDDFLKCFGNVPDAGATYSITMYTDIPVDNDPGKIFNWSTLSPGHTFIQLNKTSGNSSVQQILGFYPQTSFKSLGKYPTISKIVNNSDHEYNASLTQSLTATQFQATLNKIEAEQSYDYDMVSWNCTDFALSIFNASTYNALTIPQYKTEGSGQYMNTPQGVYTAISLLKASGNISHGSPNVNSTEAHAGKSHGSCNSNL